MVWFRINPILFGSFPESNHASSTIQFVNDCLSVKVNDNSLMALLFLGLVPVLFPVISRVKIL